MAGKADKRALYVGGLDKQVTEQGLYTAFVPFGPIRACRSPWTTPRVRRSTKYSAVNWLADTNYSLYCIRRCW